MTAVDVVGFATTKVVPVCSVVTPSPKNHWYDSVERHGVVVQVLEATSASATEMPPPFHCKTAEDHA
jgi:hypothetical protein